MGKAGKIVSRVLQTTGMVVIAGGLIAANIVANSFKEIINIYFNGFGADFSNFDSAAGNNICQ